MHVEQCDTVNESNTSESCTNDTKEKQKVQSVTKESEKRVQEVKNLINIASGTNESC